MRKKHFLFCIGIMLSGTLAAQTDSVGNSSTYQIKSIINQQNRLVINNSKILKKGDSLQVWIPAGGKDFVFVRQVKKGFGAGLLKNAAGIVGTGATAVGLGSESVNTVVGAMKVANTASAVQSGIETAEQIQDLPISKKAKEIAGKKMVIDSWKMDDNGWWIEGQIGKKKYETLLQEAVPAGEVKL